MVYETLTLGLDNDHMKAFDGILHVRLLWKVDRMMQSTLRSNVHELVGHKVPNRRHEKLHKYIQHSYVPPCQCSLPFARWRHQGKWDYKEGPLAGCLACATKSSIGSGFVLAFCFDSRISNRRYICSSALFNWLFNPVTEPCILLVIRCTWPFEPPNRQR